MYWGYIGVMLGLGSIGVLLGFYWDNGKEMETARATKI